MANNPSGQGRVGACVVIVEATDGQRDERFVFGPFDNAAAAHNWRIGSAIDDVLDEEFARPGRVAYSTEIVETRKPYGEAF